ncbi:serine/threonine-protein kinase hippo-like [Panonychus citri]|uniref:serine/threonine-protein kinase hippo-like n=1 Tax=Panonychus citri TaxID=50023 RepID=UPI002307F454|nr:serine/threonine-protein kinase hippo-like [Panonychus citri]
MVPSLNSQTLKVTPYETANDTSQGVNAKSATVKTMATVSDVESNLGTLIINDKADDDYNDRTLKPSFMQHFERNREQQQLQLQQQLQPSPQPQAQLPLHLAPQSPSQINHQIHLQSPPLLQPQLQQHQQPSQYQPLSRSILLESDFDFIRFLSNEELPKRITNLDFEMENEIEKLRHRYAAKRQRILDAIETKRKCQNQQQNF